MSDLHYSLTLHFLQAEPVAAARKLELVDDTHAAEIVKDAPLDSAVNVLKSMIPSVAAKLFQHFSNEQCQKLTESMEITDLSAILRYVDDKTRSKTLSLLSKRKQALCRMLINYPEYSIGSMVETNVLIADSKMEVSEVILRLRTRDYSYLQWVYVVDSSHALLGTLYIGDLLKAENKTKVGTLLNAKVATVNANTDLNTAMEWGLWEHNDSVPVANKQKEFIGVLHYFKLKHFASINSAKEKQNVSFSSDLFEVYGDTIINMLELVQPDEIASKNIQKNESE
ncbi:magnesium transporter MgtE N-terminal domain-containing protein [Aliiglaciecola sp. M165]|uniref:magnesium transporter MgtE N-terminal domain-containing protein n=1 Tax=Aliiglaciecola sp. M165 TaxID=2593649 RepID=UPI00117E2A0C|nr:CBS domain-containing protein [Aliiglaciecola sp. M165]TRY31064.1 magnesium transporter [Aliiglaciecola sp. M165]